MKGPDSGRQLGWLTMRLARRQDFPKVRLVV
jgi:hypothetical protein